MARKRTLAAAQPDVVVVQVVDFALLFLAGDFEVRYPLDQPRRCRAGKPLPDFGQ